MNLRDLFRNPYRTAKTVQVGPHTWVTVTPQLRAWLVARHKYLAKRRMRAAARLARMKVTKWFRWR